MENYKIAIIYAKDNQRNIEEGQIERLGDIKNKQESHSICLLEEAREKGYLTSKLFQNLTYRHRPEIISFFFTLFGHIVFLNITKDEEIYGKRGIFLMPKKITEKQILLLNDFLTEIESFEIDVFYDQEIIDGMLEAKERLITKGNAKKVFNLSGI